jgi:Uma2 family endonuclease
MRRGAISVAPHLFPRTELRSHRSAVIDFREMALHEIVLPETTPETEWVRGRALQKVSPTYDHAVLQRLLATQIGAWSDAGVHGRVGTEWRFRIAPPGEIVRPFVPDVGFITYEALPLDAPERRR